MFKYFAFVPVVLAYKTANFDLWFWTLMLIYAGSEVARAAFLYHADLSNDRVLLDLRGGIYQATNGDDLGRATRAYRLYLESRGAA